MSHATTRRRVLRGIGAASLALPLLPSLLRDADAAPSAFPKRFIFVFTSNGQRPGNFWPSWSPSWTQLGPNVREAPLQTDDGSITPILGPEFVPLQHKILLVRGLDHLRHEGGGHFPPSCLSGNPTELSVTVDQVLAASDKIYAAPPPVRSIHMLIKQNYQSPERSVAVSDAGGSPNEVPAETQVQQSYQRLFGTFVEETPDPQAEARMDLKLSVLDRVRGEYESILTSPRLGSEDKARLQAHAELLHDLEMRLAQGGGGVACTKPTMPAELDDDHDPNLPDITKNNIDLLVAGIRCDRTRIGTLQLCPGTDLRDFGFLGGPSGDHHSISHTMNQQGAQSLLFINRWYAQQIAYLLESLDVVEDPSTGSTYLDNTIVMWGNEDGCNDFDAHKPFCMPVLLAGGKNCGLKTGRYLDYRQIGAPIKYSGGNQPTDDRGRPYNSLLISILQAMGLEPGDYEVSGGGFGDYSVNTENQYSMTDAKLPLPHLLA